MALVQRIGDPLTLTVLSDEGEVILTSVVADDEDQSLVVCVVDTDPVPGGADVPQDSVLVEREAGRT